MNGPTLSITGNGIIASDPQVRQAGSRSYAKVELAELPVVEAQPRKRGLIRVDLLLPKGGVAPPKGTPITILSGAYEVNLVEGAAGEEPKRFFNINVHSWRVLKTKATDTVAEPVRDPAAPATAPAAAVAAPAKPAPKVVPPEDDDEDIPF